MASVKLEDGDVKGAVCLLCSDDRLAVRQESTFVEFCRLHPVAPIDRHPVPSTDTSSLQVSPSAVRAAIQSFPNGSSAGLDGLRPQHLKDLLIGSADDSLLLGAVTDLVNLLLEGKAPPSVQGSMFGAKIQAIAKKNGGIRPPAVDYVWRRLTAKVACNHVKEASAALFAPRKLGFGVPGGAETAVRATRLYLENSEMASYSLKSTSGMHSTLCRETPSLKLSPNIFQNCCHSHRLQSAVLQYCNSPALHYYQKRGHSKETHLFL
jgi:hypothetical protein